MTQDTSLLLHSPIGGEQIRVPCVLNDDGTITVTRSPVVPPANAAHLVLNNVSGGAPFEILMTVNNDGTLTPEYAINTFPASGIMLFQGVNGGEKIQALVDIAGDGVPTFLNVTFEGDNPTPVLPQVASATLLLDLEADTLALADGDPVSLWADQSGNGHDFTQTGDARPTKQTIDGYPAVAPDGVDDWMSSENFADNLESFAIFVVAKYIGRNNPLIGKQNIDVDWLYNGWQMYVDGSFFIRQNPTAEDYREQGWTNILPSSGDKHIFVAEKLSNSEINLYTDGVLSNGTISSVGDPITSFSSSVNVNLFVEGGINGPDDSGYSNEPLFVTMLYQITDLDNWPTDRAAITAWLAARYGITLP